MAVITAARYNNLQSKVANILGNGSGTSGYGQVLNSAQVAADTLIDSEHMSDLYTDIVAARVHQVGSVPQSIATVSAGNVIEEDSDDTGTGRGILQYEELADIIETDKDLIYVANTSQSTITPSKVASTRTASWSGTVDHVATVTFASADARRHFFNAGGEIRFTADLDPGSSTGKNNDWNNLLSQMGVVKFKSSNTTSDGSSPGTSFNIGNFDLTSTNQMIFRKDGSGQYTENDYNINAREVNTSTIEFTIQFRDDDSNVWDPDVEGTLESVIGERLPTGSYVALTSPTFATTNNLA